MLKHKITLPRLLNGSKLITQLNYYSFLIKGMWGCLLLFEETPRKAVDHVSVLSSHNVRKVSTKRRVEVMTYNMATGTER